MDVQGLQLQSATATGGNQSIDYPSGIEAMVLAILQQTVYSQQQQLGLASISMLGYQDQDVASGDVLNSYPLYLADALAANANLSSAIQSSLLNASSSSSLLPVSLLHFSSPSCLLLVLF